ncbi:hypothetical protein S40288_06868 [Stachybotrys chartarum IBT 40288]|nr:hypothetical protein S40288_06868 [Stachybotrys chartarum IBT 40288]
MSSCINLPAIEVTEHLGSDHMGMTKFSGAHDSEFKDVAAAIRRLTASTTLPSTCAQKGNRLSDLHEQPRQSLTRDNQNPEELALLELHAWDPDDLSVEDVKKFLLDCSRGLAKTAKGKKPKAQFIHESIRDLLLNDNAFADIWLAIQGDPVSLGYDKLKECCMIYFRVYGSSPEQEDTFELLKFEPAKVKHPPLSSLKKFLLRV